MRMAVALNSAVPDFGIPDIVGQGVGLGLVGKVKRHESEAGSKTAFVSHRDFNRTAPGAYANRLTFEPPDNRSPSSGEMSRVSPRRIGDR